MTTHYERDILIDYLHGALDARADAAVFAHLETCEPCRVAYDEEAAFGEALRTAARAEEREFPAMVKARVWDAVRNERPSLVARLLTGWGPRLAVPVAAALVVAATLGAPVLRNTAPNTGVSAAYYLNEHSAESQQTPLAAAANPAVYGTDAQGQPAASTASYIDTADAATVDGAASGAQ